MKTMKTKKLIALLQEFNISDEEAQSLLANLEKENVDITMVDDFSMDERTLFNILDDSLSNNESFQENKTFMASALNINLEEEKKEYKTFWRNSSGKLNKKAKGVIGSAAVLLLTGIGIFSAKKGFKAIDENKTTVAADSEDAKAKELAQKVTQAENDAEKYCLDSEYNPMDLDETKEAFKIMRGLATEKNYTPQEASDSVENLNLNTGINSYLTDWISYQIEYKKLKGIKYNKFQDVWPKDSNQYLFMKDLTKEFYQGIKAKRGDKKELSKIVKACKNYFKLNKEGFYSESLDKKYTLEDLRNKDPKLAAQIENRYARMLEQAATVTYIPGRVSDKYYWLEDERGNSSKKSVPVYDGKLINQWFVDLREEKETRISKSHRELANNSGEEGVIYVDDNGNEIKYPDKASFSISKDGKDIDAPTDINPELAYYIELFKNNRLNSKTVKTSMSNTFTKDEIESIYNQMNGTSEQTNKSIGSRC